MSEVECQMSEGRSRKSEVRGQRSEIGSGIKEFSTMSHQYFRISDNTLIFQYTASLLREINGHIQPTDSDLIISIREAIIDQKPCFKANYIDSGFVEGKPFSAEWLENLKSFNYGQPVTEYMGGPIIYYFNQE
jgi:hypothetical protein